MKNWLHVAAALLLTASTTTASDFLLTQDPSQWQQCKGMYNKYSWGGNEDPFILATFDNSTKAPGHEGIVSLLIFEWKDEDLIGLSSTPDDLERSFICSQATVTKGLCKEEQLGEYLLQPNATVISRSRIISKAIDLKNPGPPVKYPVKKTGFYCVWTFAFSAKEYQGVVTFRNTYGELPAAQIAKLPFYGGLTIVYVVIGAFWAFLYVQNRQDILPVQNYITAIIVFLIVEQLMTWGFYDYQNRHGDNLGNKIFLVATAILNAGRNSFSFFLLLIVCMGYGVVKDSLGRTMVYVRILALTHFFFGVVYGVTFLAITPETAGPIILLVLLPLAATLTAFYVWTLNSLSLTMKDLIDRKQSVKAMMYKKLWWCILGSIVVIFAFFFFNSFTLASRGDPDFVPNHWQTRWFLLDGWLNLVYLFDISFVAYLWRPTANNRRFAMSDELAQEDDGFEIASFNGAEDDDELEPGTRAKARSAANGSEYQLSGDMVSPAHVHHHQRLRQSLDGETIFAIGEETDKWSEDGDEDERKGLAGH